MIEEELQQEYTTDLNEENESECCEATIRNGLCTDCREHCE